ncbi:HpcH/HpaI aldolase/citrate lyase family protein [Bacillus paralicheniformis]|jgi:citrate lyase beta subunit|uniref:Citrate lyase beta subunit n=4 Tax=Bacillus paralicheniformis TaxID=1648923 RepID=A0A6I7TKH3_9BACI|nr:MULTISPECIES: HpcH/HpaI aldolase/citrate lyase family protein [Bacillus]ETB69081.1 ATP/GTP-binding protein [Bacillus sp. CPSM8]KJD54388.1 citrate lyase subunit beta [Bacillus amyloliquefaciens]KUL09177.1 ATP/GTP-binding protein [Bacillus licheniformis LMG 7559]KUL18592.1 ATP/GTP-binding protein [Bacillus licheniformis LMG 6934]MBC8622884.1 HpcH/HpaI aldolase/citrate lyase family protein [Robertmurraya crescens]POO77514.1 citrate lyase subunit beta [Bacillus sp. MBGLi97]
MQYFDFLSASQKEDVFFKLPGSVTKDSPKHILEHALGAALYVPGNRKDIADVMINNKYPELCSVVFCLEDSIGDCEVLQAENNLVSQADMIYQAQKLQNISGDVLPLMFIRVREPEQMLELGNKLGRALHLFTGFVFPKFSMLNAEHYLDTLTKLSQESGIVLYGMPIFETPDLLAMETRAKALQELKSTLGFYQDIVLNIRIGATDLCGLYGIRRKPETPIYDVLVISDFIKDIVNYFGLQFVISGPVWEYFEDASRTVQTFGPNWADAGESSLVINRYIDGLINETLLDLANGIHGKSVIHPSQIKAVQSLHVISMEDYLDALSIVESADGTRGVVKSSFSNKMIEIKPYLSWAKKILLKAEIYGVYHENRSYTDILRASKPLSNLGSFGS